jgi:hypothetical protein
VMNLVAKPVRQLRPGRRTKLDVAKPPKRQIEVAQVLKHQTVLG